MGRKVQFLAKGLANLMEPGAHLHRSGVGLHAFAVDGAVCLAAAYHEPEGDTYRYRYAVLCGGEAAKRALRTAVLDPSDCDEPGLGRRIAPATNADYDDFVYRLPKFIADVTRRLEDRFSKRKGSTFRSGLPADSWHGQASRTRLAQVGALNDVLRSPILEVEMAIARRLPEPFDGKPCRVGSPRRRQLRSATTCSPHRARTDRRRLAPTAGHPSR